jgi:hypothetical protein
VRGMGNTFLSHPTLRLGTREGALWVREVFTFLFLSWDNIFLKGGANPLGKQVK